MKITKVAISEFNKDYLKAFATITFDESFVVSGLKVMEKKSGGLWVAMPNRKSADNEYIDICFPVTKELRKHIEDEVLRKYHETTEPYVEVPRKNDQHQERPKIDVSEDDLPF